MVKELKEIALEIDSISLLIDLRQHLDLSRPVEERSGYLTDALNYLQHFWKELTMFVTDGSLPSTTI